MAPRILNLGSGLVSLTHQPLHPRAKNPRRPLNKKLLGLQSQSGRFDVEENTYLVSVQTGRLRGNSNLVTDI